MAAEHNVLKLSCSCGAQLIYEEIVTQSYYANVSRRQRDFLEAHEICRTKANNSDVVKKLFAQPPKGDK